MVRINPLSFHGSTGPIAAAQDMDDVGPLSPRSAEQARLAELSHAAERRVTSRRGEFAGKLGLPVVPVLSVSCSPFRFCEGSCKK